MNMWRVRGLRSRSHWNNFGTTISLAVNVLGTLGNWNYESNTVFKNTVTDKISQTTSAPKCVNFGEMMIAMVFK